MIENGVFEECIKEFFELFFGIVMRVREESEGSFYKYSFMLIVNLLFSGEYVLIV